jgi:chromosomal replication initiation ATPase DnaA
VLLGDLIVALLGQRGVVTPPEVAEFLVPRIERTYVAVQQVVDVLDRAMLSRHRRMTVPMARNALSDAGLIRRARNQA